MHDSRTRSLTAIQHQTPASLLNPVSEDPVLARVLAMQSQQAFPPLALAQLGLPEQRVPVGPLDPFARTPLGGSLPLPSSDLLALRRAQMSSLAPSLDQRIGHLPMGTDNVLLQNILEGRSAQQTVGTRQLRPQQGEYGNQSARDPGLSDPLKDRTG